MFHQQGAGEVFQSRTPCTAPASLSTPSCGSPSPSALDWMLGSAAPRARGERQGQSHRWGWRGGQTRGLFVGKHGVTAGCLLLRKMLSSLMAPRSDEQRSSVPDGERESVRGNLQLFQQEKGCNTGRDYFTDQFKKTWRCGQASVTACATTFRTVQHCKIKAKRAKPCLWLKV